MNKNTFLGGVLVLAFVLFMAYGAFMQPVPITAQEEEPEGPELLASLIFDSPYTGFPPTIPHPVENRVGKCNLCHDLERSTSVPQTPHPERFNCIQCHVNH